MLNLVDVVEVFEEDMNQHLGVLKISSLQGWSCLDFEEGSVTCDLLSLRTALHNVQTHVG
ncbi:MAG: hypothetical protein WCG10_06460 [Chlamydiota bacterium]